MHKQIIPAKLTSKQAWQSNAIDTLSSLDPPSTRDDIINIGHSIDASLRIYSMRIDNVVDMTSKLLERMVQVRKRRKNTANTLVDKESVRVEKRVALWDKEMREVRRCNVRNDCLLRTVGMDRTGCMMVLGEVPVDAHRVNYGAFLCSRELQGYLQQIRFADLFVCPTLKGVKASENAEEIEFDNFLDIDEHMLENEVPMNEGSVDHEVVNDAMDEDVGVDARECIFTDKFDATPFSYHKAWAGPQNWRILSGRKACTARKRTKKDFLEQFDRKALGDRRSSLLREEDVLKRRADDKCIVKDYGVVKEDLYALNMLKEWFRIEDPAYATDTVRTDPVYAHDTTNTSISHVNARTVENTSMHHALDNSIINSFIDHSAREINTEHVPIPIEDELQMNGPLNTASTHLLKKYARMPKKVDIKRLEQHISTVVRKSKQLGIKEMFNAVKEYYGEKEMADVSWQVMFVGVLELANFKELRIKEEGEQIVLVHGEG